MEFSNLKTCFKICREVLSGRVYAFDVDPTALPSFGLSEGTVMAVGYLLHKGVLVDQDWHPIRALYSNGLIMKDGRFTLEKKTLAERIMTRIKPSFVKLSPVDQHIISSYLDYAVLLVFEFAAWSWVQEVERANTIHLSQNRGRRFARPPVGSSESLLTGAKFKLRAPAAVLSESTRLVEEHKRRIKWARRKISSERDGESVQPLAHKPV